MTVTFIGLGVATKKLQKTMNNSPEEVLHGRTKYWHLINIFLKFAHICCCSSSHCGVPAFKLIHVLSLQASSDPTSHIGIVSFSSSI